jgi:hypothetical protein
MSDEDDNDDRYERWIAANGVVKTGWRTTDDGRQIMIYLRADGTEVTAANSYGYDDFTPFSPTAGRA